MCSCVLLVHQATQENKLFALFLTSAPNCLQFKSKAQIPKRRQWAWGKTISLSCIWFIVIFFGTINVQKKVKDSSFLLSKCFYKRCFGSFKSACFCRVENQTESCCVVYFQSVFEHSLCSWHIWEDRKPGLKRDMRQSRYGTSEYLVKVT